MKSSLQQLDLNTKIHIIGALGFWQLKAAQIFASTWAETTKCLSQRTFDWLWIPLCISTLFTSPASLCTRVWVSITGSKCVSLCMCMCVGRSSGCLCCTWLSYACFLLPGLSSLASHSAVTPSPPIPSLAFQMHCTQGGRANLLFSVSDLCPVPNLFLFSPLSSPLTKSLFSWYCWKPYGVCDIIRAGSRERGNGRAGERLVAKSLCSDVSSKALWEATWGVRAEQVGFFLKISLPPG